MKKVKVSYIECFYPGYKDRYVYKARKSLRTSKYGSKMYKVSLHSGPGMPNYRDGIAMATVDDDGNGIRATLEGGHEFYMPYHVAEALHLALKTQDELDRATQYRPFKKRKEKK